MKYEQPNVALLGNATDVVLGNKGFTREDNVVPGSEILTDGAAYQADE